MRSFLSILVLLFCSVPASSEISGDPGKGKSLYKYCISCHQIGKGAKNRAGPHLNGIIGRKAGSVEKYKYSKALSSSGLVWDIELLDRFIEDPQGVLPENKMAYRGLSGEYERADLIAFMAEFSDADSLPPVEISPEVQAILEIDGDEAYGEYLSTECTACHASGEAGIPPIEGLSQERIISALVSYRDGSRKHQVMEMLSKRLGNEEIAAIAKLYSNLKN